MRLEPSKLLLRIRAPRRPPTPEQNRQALVPVSDLSGMISWICGLRRRASQICGSAVLFLERHGGQCEVVLAVVDRGWINGPLACTVLHGSITMWSN